MRKISWVSHTSQERRGHGKCQKLFKYCHWINSFRDVTTDRKSADLWGFTNQRPWPYGPMAHSLELFITNKLSTILTMYSIRIRLKIATKHGLKFMDKILLQLVRIFSK